MNPHALAPGSLVGRYRVVEKLGQGGMGAVFKAVDAQGGREVALKLLLADEPALVKRFEREARAAQAIEHENVAKTFDAFVEAGSLVLVVELLRGGTLKEVVRTRGKLPWREAAALGAGIARGLAAVHAAGFVHRDLKPENVLLDGEGRPKITDFGLVRRAPGAAVSQALTKTGEVVGTMAYMAPEQLDGKHVDERADLYSLGATLYDLLAGEPPFTGSSLAIVKRILLEAPPSVREAAPDVPRELERLIRDLLAKEPLERPSSAGYVATALEALAAGKTAGPSRSRAPLVAAVALAAVVLGGGAAVLASRTPGPAPQPPPSPATPPAPPPGPVRPDPEEALRKRFGNVRAEGALSVAKVLGHDEPGHSGEVRALAFKKRRGKLVVFSAGADGGDAFLRTWDAATGEAAFAPIVCKGKEIRSIAVSDDGERIVYGSRDGRVVYVNERGEERSFFSDPGQGDVVVALSPDGKTVLAGTRAQVLLVFNVESGEQSDPIHAGASIWFVRFAPGGDRAAVGLSDGRVVGLDVRAQSLVAGNDGSVHGGQPATEGVFVGGWLATVGNDYTLAVLDRSSLALSYARPVQPEGGGELIAIDAFPDGKRVATGGRDGIVEVWDLASRKRIQVLPAQPSHVNAIAVSPDGKSIATGAVDGTVRVIDVETGREPLWPVLPAGHRGAVESVAVSNDGSRVLTAGADGTVKVWDARSGNVVRSEEKHPVGGAAGAAFLDDDHILSVGQRDLLRLWSLSGRTAERRGKIDAGHDWATSLALSPDRKHAVVLRAYNERPIHFDLTDTQLTGHVGEHTAFFAAYSPDSRTCAVANSYVRGASSQFDLVDPASFVAQPHRVDVTGEIHRLAYLPSGGLVVGLDQGPLLRLDLDAAGPAVWQVNLHRTARALATTDDWVAAALDDGQIVLLDNAAKGEVETTGIVRGRASLDGAEDLATSCAFDLGGRTLWVGTARGALVRMNVRAR